MKLTHLPLKNNTFEINSDKLLSEKLAPMHLHAYENIT